VKWGDLIDDPDHLLYRFGVYETKLGGNLRETFQLLSSFKNNGVWNGREEKSIEATGPNILEKARTDPDFELIRDHPKFRALFEE